MKSTTGKNISTRLGPFVNIRTGKLDANANNPNGDYPFFTCSRETLKIDHYAYDCECVLVAGNGDLNAKYYKGKFNAYQRTYIIESKDYEVLDVRYLYRFMDMYVEKLRSGSIGGVIKYIRLSHLTDIKIPLPPLPEQKRIAAILDKADAVRCKRQRAIQLADEFLRSVFLDMFGDSVRNPKNFEIKKLGNLLKYLTSGSRGWAKYYSKTGAKFIRIQNVRKNELSLENLAYVNAPASAEANRTKVRTGDILLSITADLGRTGVVPSDIGEAYINQHLAILRVSSAEPIYISTFLASKGGELQIQRLNRQGVKSGLNFEDIRSLDILAPPIRLQTKFVQVWTEIQQMKTKIIDFIHQSDINFKSLSFQAFRGEL